MKEDNANSGQKLVYGAAAVAALGGLLFGFDTGVISGALLFLKKDFALGSTAQEMVVSAVLIGCILGAASSGKLADRLGRRKVIMVCAMVFALGSLATSFAWSEASLIWGRIIIGLAIGVASFTVPLYISEISPPDRRGALVSLNQLMITIGIVVSYLVDDIFAFSDLGWRYMFAMGLLPALALGLGMIFLPQSPRWLMERGREGEARKVLSRLLGGKGVDREIQDIRATLPQADATGWKEMRAPWLRPALFIGVGIMAVQQATGINTVIYYAPTIFQMAGFESATAAIGATVGVGVVNVAFTVVSIKLVDRWGRKPLLSVGLIGMVISLLALGGAFWFDSSGAGGLKWMAMISLVVYIAAFAVSLGPVAWLIISEIYPLKIRGLAMSLATLANWLFNLAVSMSFLSILEVLGKPGTFWLYAGVGVAGWFFCRFYVPETKGRTLETIEANLRAGRPARDLGEARG